MDVGFCLGYRPDETGRVAARLAEFAAGRGYGVRFFSMGPPLGLDPRWDRLVTWDAHCPFERWARALRPATVVFVGPAPPAFLGLAAAAGARTVAVVDWGRPWAGDPKAVGAADAVVALTPRAAALAAGAWGVAHARCIPWVPAHPPQGHAPRPPGPVKVLVPCAEDQPARAAGDVLHAIGAVLAAAPAAAVTLLHSPRCWTARSNRAVRRLAARHAGRFAAACVTPRDRAAVLAHYGRCDVVAWPSGHEWLGTTGLDALAMGAPVVALDVPPQNEYLTHGVNGLLVPCPVRHTAEGAPAAEGGLGAFAGVVAGLAGDPARVAELRAGAGVGLGRRLAEFEAGWDAVLSGV